MPSTPQRQALPAPAPPTQASSVPQTGRDDKIDMILQMLQHQQQEIEALKAERRPHDIPTPSRDLGRLPSQPEMNPRAPSNSSDPTYPPRAQAKSVTILRSGEVLDDEVGVKYTESERDCIISSVSEERHVQREEKRETHEREIGESSTHSHRGSKQPAVESERQREPEPEKVAPFPSALEKPAPAEEIERRRY